MQTMSVAPPVEKALTVGSNGHAATYYTAHDLLALSTDDTHRYELIRGKLLIMPPAGFAHGDYAMRLGARMRVYAEDHTLGAVVAAETGFLLEQNPDTVRAPDVGFVCQARLPLAQGPTSYFPGPPDLAVEVKSPNDALAAVIDKAHFWLRYGVQLVWIVDPQSESVLIYRLDGSHDVLSFGSTLDGEDLLPGFRYPVARLFLAT